MANAVAMRLDIHRAFNDCRFVIVRKGGLWVAHFLELTNELGMMYHNKPLEVAPGVSASFLLVRFAWAVFPRVKAFLEAGGPKLVRVRERSVDGVSEVNKIINVADILRILGTGRGRSASAKKRKASSPAMNLLDILEAKRSRRGEDAPSPQSSRSTFLYATGQISDFQGRQCHVASLASAVSSPQHTSANLSLPEREVVRMLHAPDTDPDEARIAALRIQELRKQRPKDPTLVCCDYTLAENANALGIEGKPEYGGGHLCMECLGLEVIHDDSLDPPD
ncbi:hypothetical protein LTR66_001485 [Elasticomyces elasticus]|nr:hypothetical protein LTR66_001485 [Elasticomyces elasticus]